MRPVIVDAGVAVKWLFRHWDREADVDQALGLLEEVKRDRLRLYHPAH